MHETQPGHILIHTVLEFPTTEAIDDSDPLQPLMGKSSTHTEVGGRR